MFSGPLSDFCLAPLTPFLSPCFHTRRLWQAAAFLVMAAHNGLRTCEVRPGLVRSAFMNHLATTPTLLRQPDDLSLPCCR